MSDTLSHFQKREELDLMGGRQRLFEELLLDADWALVSALAFASFHQFQAHGAVTFGKEPDSEGKYIKKNVPQLTKNPSRVFYEPWKASLDV